jgi:hypothetical protein
MPAHTLVESLIVANLEELLFSDSINYWILFYQGVEHVGAYLAIVSANQHIALVHCILKLELLICIKFAAQLLAGEFIRSLVVGVRDLGVRTLLIFSTISLGMRLHFNVN